VVPAGFNEVSAASMRWRKLVHRSLLPLGHSLQPSHIPVLVSYATYQGLSRVPQRPGIAICSLVLLCTTV
jgi:hypothetical protein